MHPHYSIKSKCRTQSVSRFFVVVFNSIVLSYSDSFSLVVHVIIYQQKKIKKEFTTFMLCASNLLYLKGSNCGYYFVLTCLSMLH